MHRHHILTAWLIIGALLSFTLQPLAVTRATLTRMACRADLSTGTTIAPSTFEDAEYYRKAANDKKATADGGTLLFDPDAKAVRFLVKGSPQFDIPYDRVTSMLYERTAKPRYTLGLLVAWPLLFTKSKKHFLTIQYKGADGQGQFALIRLDKKNYQEALATAEAQTGVKVNRAEEK